MAGAYGVPLNHRVARSLVGRVKVGGVEVVLAKPKTFMNLSGEAVAALLFRHRLSTADLLVIYDDLDLALGRIRIRERGSSGGHKGMESIIARLGSRDFARLRLGIAPLEDGADPTNRRAVDAIGYVLSDFTGDEKAVMKEAYARAAAAVQCVVEEGIAAAMNKFN